MANKTTNIAVLGWGNGPGQFMHRASGTEVISAAENSEGMRITNLMFSSTQVNCMMIVWLGDNPICLGNTAGNGYLSIKDVDRFLPAGKEIRAACYYNAADLHIEYEEIPA